MEMDEKLKNLKTALKEKTVQVETLKETVSMLYFLNVLDFIHGVLCKWYYCVRRFHNSDVITASKKKKTPYFDTWPTRKGRFLESFHY